MALSFHKVSKSILVVSCLLLLCLSASVDNLSPGEVRNSAGEVIPHSLTGKTIEEAKEILIGAGYVLTMIDG
jgi:hypothetical protein